MDFSFAALVLSIVLILIGLGAAWLCKLFELDTGSSAWAFVLGPIAAYLLLSGALVEISAGDFSAKLREKAEAPLSDEILLSEGLKESLIAVDALEDDLDTDVFMGIAKRVHVLVLAEIEALNENQKEALAATLATGIYQGLLAGAFEALVFVNSDEEPVAVFEKSLFLDLLRIPLERFVVPAAHRTYVLKDNEVKARVYETNIWDIVRFPSQRAESVGNKAFIFEDTSRAEALAWMIESNYEVAVVVDDDGEYEGLITRQRLVDATVSDLLNALVD